MKQSLVDKNELISYLMYVHENEYDFEIGRIKLQKSLYFLYAFWIKNISQSNLEQTEISDLVSELSDQLFAANFVAWSYGPVDADVYRDHKNNKLRAFNESEAHDFLSSLQAKNEYLSQYIQSMTRTIFNTSDFGLVDLSHRDSAWIKNYDPSVEFPNQSISHEDIASDYEVN